MKFSPPRTAGFSLVEVTLAIGLVTFGLLSVVGLLPGGMSNLRESTEQMVHAQILASVSEMLAVSDFDAATNGVEFFDEEGHLVLKQGDARYKATLTEVKPSIPGVDPTGMSAHLKRLQVGIARIDMPNAPAGAYALQVAAH